MNAVLTHLRARLGEVSSIIAASGAAGVLAAYALGEISGKRAAIGAAAAIVAYVWPETRAGLAGLQTVAKGIAVLVLAGAALLACASVSSLETKARPVVNAAACDGQAAANVATDVLALTDPAGAAKAQAASRLLGLLCFTTAGA